MGVTRPVPGGLAGEIGISECLHALIQMCPADAL